MLEPFRLRALLLKIEGTEGTDSVPTPEANAFELFDGRAGLLADVVERPKDRPYFTNDPFSLANLGSFIEGNFEIVAPSIIGGASPVGPLLRIASLEQSLIPGPPAFTRYLPVSTGIPSATAYWYHSGTFRKVLGARANLTGLSMEIGQVMRGALRIEGQYVDVEEAALPTPDYSAFTTPRICSTESMELLVDGFAVDGKALSIDLGNTLQRIEHTEARIARIGDRRATFSTRFYRSGLGDFNPFAKWKAGAIVPLIGTQLEADNSRYTRLNVRGQIEAINEVEIDNDYGWEITGRCIASSAGGDEIGIEHGVLTS